MHLPGVVDSIYFYYPAGYKVNYLFRSWQYKSARELRKMKKVLITDKVHDILITSLKSAGFGVDYEPDVSPDMARHMVEQYNGLIVNSRIPCNRSFLDHARHLDFIGRLGSGLDFIDLKAARQHNIEIISSPEGNAQAVAEHVIGMLLCLSNNLCKANREVRMYDWQRESNRGKEIGGNTIGILGFGHTGSAVAHRLSTWGMNILTFDKYKKNINASCPYVGEVSMDDLLRHSDILSIHLPLTNETLGWVGRDFLHKMKPGAILINSSRGPIVKLAALVNALENGHLGGACLDVLENEVMSDLNESERATLDRLFLQERVILSPHIAGWTVQSLQKIAGVLADKILNFYHI